MAKKGFRNAAASFITAPAQPDQEEQKEKKIDPASIPLGYTIAKEKKTRRVQLLLRPSVWEVVQETAKELGTTPNNLANDIIEEYVNKRKDGDAK